MIICLNESHIDEMLALQALCLENDDIFLPTSREGYLRAFQFDNFCYGYMENGELIAFLNCAIPTARARNNLGRGRLPDGELNRVGYMNTLLVKKSCRHHGVGRELVEAALAEFAKRNCPHVFVTASPENAASLRLLAAMDFQKVNIIDLRGERRCLLYRKL
ncbi:MAG: GNAT family N-acetyltransferase [Clostridia bacterium]|nr:GNAT family N-acetyltransferase [Clostridia bacterium]